MSKKPEALFVKSKIREIIKDEECNVSGEVIDGDILNEKIEGMIREAARRAKGNNRKTIYARDI